MKNIFVSEQAKILLQRMSERPEDFYISNNFSSRLGITTSWADIVSRGSFNLIESFLINRKFRAIQRRKTQQDILEQLVAAKEKIAVEEYPTITIPSGNSIK